MIEAYMQVDLNNSLAVAYMNHALKSFEIVSDIFHVNVLQCVTPDTLLDELKNASNQLTRRSPQELASLHSNYRIAKRIANGEKIWALEHDAYLRSEHEDVFRMIMSKWLSRRSTLNLGMANEFWTTTQEIAQDYCLRIERGWEYGPMSLLHRCTDSYHVGKKQQYTTYWPANRYKNRKWCNMTGVGYNVSSAYNSGKILLNSPICQILDERYGGTVVDRKKKIYYRELHPDVKWITLDNY